MTSWTRDLVRSIFLAVLIFLVPCLHASPAPSWSGVLRDSAGNPIGGATIKLVAAESKREYSATTSTAGEFSFTSVEAGNYKVTVSAAGRNWTAADNVAIKDGATAMFGLQLPPEGQEFHIVVAQDSASPQASGGEHLSTGGVSSLPLNERDFSKLLLLAAGTMTDTNGAANFTQQFAVNGQRGSAAVFAMDGAD